MFWLKKCGVNVAVSSEIGPLRHVTCVQNGYVDQKMKSESEMPIFGGSLPLNDLF